MYYQIDRYSVSYVLFCLAPAKPALNPRPLNATENTLTISWTVSYDGGKPITKYTIKWGIGTMRLDHTENLSTQETTYTLNELKKGTEYYVQVQAENDKGTNSSDTVSYTTLCCKSITFWLSYWSNNIYCLQSPVPHLISRSMTT